MNSNCRGTGCQIKECGRHGRFLQTEEKPKFTEEQVLNEITVLMSTDKTNTVYTHISPVKLARFLVQHLNNNS